MTTVPWWNGHSPASCQDLPALLATERPATGWSMAAVTASAEVAAVTVVATVGLNVT
jgi:hypothetical protein